MKHNEIIINIKTKEVDKYHIPEYYYYDKVKNTIASGQGKPIPYEYCEAKARSKPQDLKHPYKVGIFQANKLIGIHSDVFGEIVQYPVILTAKQKELPIIHKVFNFETKEIIVVKKRTKKKEIDISKVHEGITKFLHELYIEGYASKVETKDKQFIITINEHSSEI